MALDGAHVGYRSGAGDEGEEALLALCGVSLAVRRGGVTGVVGAVGSGKSTLLLALLQELPLQQGSAGVAARDPVAYLAQSPAVINGTIRDNVTFCEPYDEQRYEECLAAAMLGPDLAILPAGDLTEAGERGVNLSGGQKARVAFARCLYHRERASAVVMDDPFSAVDPPTARHMWTQGVERLLTGHTVVIALSSHLHLLEHAAHVVALDRAGSVAVQGKYSDVVAAGMVAAIEQDRVSFP